MLQCLQLLWYLVRFEKSLLYFSCCFNAVCDLCSQSMILQRYNNIILAACHHHRLVDPEVRHYGFIKLHCCVKWYLEPRAGCGYPSVGPRICAKLLVFTFLTLVKVFRCSDWTGGVQTGLTLLSLICACIRLPFTGMYNVCRSYRVAVEH